MKIMRLDVVKVNVGCELLFFEQCLIVNLFLWQCILFLIFKDFNFGDRKLLIKYFEVVINVLNLNFLNFLWKDFKY